MKYMDYIKKYNSSDTVFVISLYPKRGEVYSSGTSGVASYAKNVVSNMNRTVIVLADIDTPRGSHGFTSSTCHPRGRSMYEEGNVLVVRCFKKDTPFMWFSILREMRKFDMVKTVLLQYDFAVYGGIFPSSFVIPFLGIVRLFGYRTHVILHHVILNISKLSGHVGLGRGKKDQFKAFLYNSIFHMFYLLLGVAANHIVVLEEKLKERLGRIIRSRKITAIPHGVDTTLASVSKENARRLLGIEKNDSVILFFGFVNWFKGADFFATTFDNQKHMLGKKIRCIIAGGESPTLTHKKYYKKYFQKVKRKISTSKTVEMTGYIPQDAIALYFSACDLVVFPYRHFMTASGVLSLVFSYKKPFIISSHISEMFDAPDFQEALRTAGIRKDDIVFDLTKVSCISKTEDVLKDGLKTKMTYMAEILRRERSYKNTAFLYEQLILSAISTTFIEYSEVFQWMKKRLRFLEMV